MARKPLSSMAELATLKFKVKLRLFRWKKVKKNKVTSRKKKKIHTWYMCEETKKRNQRLTDTEKERVEVQRRQREREREFL